MSVERRFLTSYREQEISQPGLIQEDDGSVSHVALDGTRTTLPGTGGVLPDTGGASEGNVLALAAGLNPAWQLGIQLSKTTLIDEELRGLPTTPVQVVGDPGDDHLVLFVAAIVGPMQGPGYDNIDPSSAMKFQYAVAASEDASGSFPQLDNILGDTEPRSYFEVGSLAAYNGHVLRVAAGGAVSEGIYLAMDNAGSGNLTGGDPANAMVVWVSYVVLDLAA